MDISIKTKHNVGDIIYIVDHYYDFYAHQRPYIVTDVLVDINKRRTRIQYEIEQDDTMYRVPEEWTFYTYEESSKWCDEHN